MTNTQEDTHGHYTKRIDKRGIILIHANVLKQLHKVLQFRAKTKADGKEVFQLVPVKYTVGLDLHAMTPDTELLSCRDH